MLIFKSWVGFETFIYNHKTDSLFYVSLRMKTSSIHLVPNEWCCCTWSEFLTTKSANADPFQISDCAPSLILYLIQVIFVAGCYKLVHLQGYHSDTRGQVSKTSRGKLGCSWVASHFGWVASLRGFSTRVSPQNAPKHFPDEVNVLFEHIWCITRSSKMLILRTIVVIKRCKTSLLSLAHFILIIYSNPHKPCNYINSPLLTVNRRNTKYVSHRYNQEEGIDYEEPFASVARLESIRMLAFACYKNFSLYQIDVKSVFLNGYVNEEVYVEQPCGFTDSLSWSCF